MGGGGSGNLLRGEIWKRAADDLRMYSIGKLKLFKIQREKSENSRLKSRNGQRPGFMVYFVLFIKSKMRPFCMYFLSKSLTS